ncbi:hypothetical protein GDO81_018884 [Engystomops pustulosus]|uniref:Uncharacterized protein n=1 Tax=Engystomops pustulosus TaxID=76066 RepID=A0AAV6YIW3_ENGPU|nr:hypothetical protein GDO81_018884 [Engystomops pustulosus]
MGTLANIPLLSSTYIHLVVLLPMKWGWWGPCFMRLLSAETYRCFGTSGDEDPPQVLLQIMDITCVRPWPLNPLRPMYPHQQKG